MTRDEHRTLYHHTLYRRFPPPFDAFKIKVDEWESDRLSPRYMLTDAGDMYTISRKTGVNKRLTMTRDEHRTACIKAIRECHDTYVGGYFSDFLAARILDSLHGVARVVPLEATEEMIEAATCRGVYPRSMDEVTTFPAKIFAAMAAAGDLTNPPEVKHG